jgi:hypothetical protein
MRSFTTLAKAARAKPVGETTFSTNRSDEPRMTQCLLQQTSRKLLLAWLADTQGIDQREHAVQRRVFL